MTPADLALELHQIDARASRSEANAAKKKRNLAASARRRVSLEHIDGGVVLTIKGRIEHHIFLAFMGLMVTTPIVFAAVSGITGSAAIGGLGALGALGLVGLIAAIPRKWRIMVAGSGYAVTRGRFRRKAQDVGRLKDLSFRHRGNGMVHFSSPAEDHVFYFLDVHHPDDIALIAEFRRRAGMS